MDRKSSETIEPMVVELRSVLKSQYHAALAMLHQTIELCPETLWMSQDYTTTCWQIAYHTLFITHLYVQPNEAAFRPWEHHQEHVQYQDGIPGPPDPQSLLPLIPEPYTQKQLLAYWHFCDQMIDDAVDALDILSPESGFYWYKVSKLEHQIVNIRHIEHHLAQLADRLRTVAGLGIDWVGACHKKKTDETHS